VRVTVAPAERAAIGSFLGGPGPWVIFAFLATVAYGLYLAPDWEPIQDDQADYLQLAQGVAARAEFTRAVPGEPFIGEPHRRPGYPLFLALLCKTVACDHWQIAIAQAALFACTVALTFVLARSVVPRRATIAAALVAIYLPIAYFASLALSEMLATFLLIGTILLYLRSRTAGVAWAFASGASAGFLALTRPVFTLLPLLLIATELVAEPEARARRPRAVLAIVLGAALMGLPFLGYSYASFGSPLASTSGTVLWSGYLQGKTRGLPADLDRFREAALARADDATVVRLGAAISLDDVESREAAAAFRDVAVFESAPDQRTRIASFVTLNESLDARALRLIAHDPGGYLLRAITVRTPALFATDVPVRVSDASSIPLSVRVALFAGEFALFIGALAGAALLLRTRSPTAALVVGAFFYVWLVSVPFLVEGRYAIPARPFMAIAVAQLAAHLLSRRPGRAAEPATARSVDGDLRR
jgi:hypothetical protein